MSERRTLKLENPFEVDDGEGGRLVGELNFRTVRAGDLFRMQASEDQGARYALELAAYLTGETQQVINRIEGRDVGRVLEIVGELAEELTDSPAELSVKTSHS